LAPSVAASNGLNMLHSIVQTVRENNALVVNSAAIGGELVTSGKGWNYGKDQRYSQKKPSAESGVAQTAPDSL
jgi:hypothetical protein